ncbi:MAG: S8 family serine peptidase [Nanoarchaeota archaeon]|nr:S8 family serine peptidase [Nanoarchaeota archaeon]
MVKKVVRHNTRFNIMVILLLLALLFDMGIFSYGLTGQQTAIIKTTMKTTVNQVVEDGNSPVHPPITNIASKNQFGTTEGFSNEPLTNIDFEDEPVEMGFYAHFNSQDNSCGPRVLSELNKIPGVVIDDGILVYEDDEVSLPVKVDDYEGSDYFFSDGFISFEAPFNSEEEMEIILFEIYKNVYPCMIDETILEIFDGITPSLGTDYPEGTLQEDFFEDDEEGPTFDEPNEDYSWNFQLFESVPLIEADIFNGGLYTFDTDAVICVIDSKIPAGSNAESILATNLLTYTSNGNAKVYAYDAKKKKEGNINKILTTESSSHGQVMVETINSISPNAFYMYAAVEDKPTKKAFKNAVDWCLGGSDKRRGPTPDVILSGVSAVAFNKNKMVDRFYLVTNHLDAISSGNKKGWKSVKAVWKKLKKGLERTNQWDSPQTTPFVMGVGNSFGVGEASVETVPILQDGVQRLAALDHVFGVGSGYDETFSYPTVTWNGELADGSSIYCGDGPEIGCSISGTCVPGISERDIMCYSACYHTSTKNNMIDIIAPGHDIVTPCGDAFSCGTDCCTDTNYGAGTSFAATHVAASILLMKSTGVPFTVDDMHTIFENSADPVGSTSHNPSTDVVPAGCYGYGFINTKKAVGELVNPSP